MTDADIEQRFPGVKILQLRSAFHPGKLGWGVELDGWRNAWMIDDTPQEHDAARQRAVTWLERVQADRGTDETRPRTA